MIFHHSLELTCAATAIRSSEILALRWAEIPKLSACRIT
jgi:integrase